MIDGIKKKSKVINKIFMTLAILLIVVVVSLCFLWNRYSNKNNLLKKFETQGEQEVYLLGTLHKNHFNKWVNYSMEDILGVAKNIQPDAVFIEAREQYFEDYGVIDGPIDMAVVYSYCIDNNIPVSEFTEGDHDAFYNQQLQFNELFWENRLYQ